MDWNEGYVADVEYTAGFYKELSPAYLNYVCVLNGFEPIQLDKPYTYFELGCGQGFTANLLAASNPDGRFYAADFLPAQVARANQLTTAAQLANLTILESRFADLAHGRVPDLPQFDFITLHGVYTWVSAENRRHIVDFMARYLKPGGIVYLSYNAMPGWSSALPLQKLLMEYADVHPDRSDIQIVQARNFIERLSDIDARYFVENESNGMFKNCFDSLIVENPSNLVHEYMNRDWLPMYHADVAQDLWAAKLDFAASADVHMAFPHHYLSAEKQKLVNALPGSRLRETVKDYLLNTGFRRDVFIRGARRMNPVRRLQWLRQTGMALIVPRDIAVRDLYCAGSKVTMKKEMCRVLIDTLVDGPQTLGALAGMPGTAGSGMDELVEVMAILVAEGLVSPYFDSGRSTDDTAARRLNAELAEQSQTHDTYKALASPLLGNGMASGLVQRLVYRALVLQKGEIDAIATAHAVRAVLSAQGLPVMRDDTVLESEPDIEAELLSTVTAILSLRVPIWRQLKML
ncbi:MAG TPA: class I SAM-dependent methyltransferase [Noviherbaspirillum sp.]|nr:class I SAM-dependent methyltransferase [Noviherbaspirillum sp.]